MTQALDTGYPSPQRTLLTQGAIGLLGRMHFERGGYLRHVGIFGGLVHSYTNELDVETIVKNFGRCPSILVATGTRTFETINVQATQAISEVELLLYFGSQHSRDWEIGRLSSDQVSQIDPRADPGLNVMMEHALELMHGAYPQDAMRGKIKQIRIQQEEELVTAPAITIWLQTYRVKLMTLTPAAVPGGASGTATAGSGGGVRWRSPEQILQSFATRITTNLDEAHLPAPATDSTTLDSITTLP